MIKKIDSVDNPIIKKAILIKNRKYRDREKLFLIEGQRIVRDAIIYSKNNELVEYVFFTEENANFIAKEYHEALNFKKILISEKIAKELSDTIVTQGVFALLRKQEKDLSKELEKYSRILLLDNLADPGNVGTIIRTALAARFDAVLAFKGTADFYNPKTIRSTMGAVVKLDLYDSLEYENVYKMLKEKEFKIFVADLQGDKKIYDSFSEEKIALLLGSEAHGVLFPEEYIDGRIYIPMDPEAESLNVSVAAGIIMYSINKSRLEK